eukprot:9354048-Heterocapsa_arctica.AAC.1
MEIKKMTKYMHMCMEAYFTEIQMRRGTRANKDHEGKYNNIRWTKNNEEDKSIDTQEYALVVE